MSNQFNSLQFTGDVDFDLLPGANTIRRGDKYAEIPAGTVLKVLNDKGDEVREVTVAEVVTCRIGKAINLYAYNNIAVLSAEAAGTNFTVEPAVAAENDGIILMGPYLLNELKRAYGADAMVDMNQVATVITFEALDPPAFIEE